MSKPLTRYALESYVQGFHERHEMTADPDGRWYAKDEADARIASLETEVARLEAACAREFATLTEVRKQRDALVRRLEELDPDNDE